MMLYWEFCQVYIVILKALLWKTSDGSWWSKLLLRCVSYDRQACAICVLSFKRNSYCDAMKVLSGYCNSMVHQLINQSIGYCMWCDPKSYSRYYVHFCVPWILEVFTNDPCAATTNDCVCCLHQLSICVGICSICWPWFSWGLVGCGALPSHL